MAHLLRVSLFFSHSLFPFFFLSLSLLHFPFSAYLFIPPFLSYALDIHFSVPPPLPCVFFILSFSLSIFSPLSLSLFSNTTFLFQFDQPSRIFSLFGKVLLFHGTSGEREKERLLENWRVRERENEWMSNILR